MASLRLRGVPLRGRRGRRLQERGPPCRGQILGGLTPQRRRTEDERHAVTETHRGTATDASAARAARRPPAAEGRSPVADARRRCPGGEAAHRRTAGEAPRPDPTRSPPRGNILCRAVIEASVASAARAAASEGADASLRRRRRRPRQPGIVRGSPSTAWRRPRTSEAHGAEGDRLLAGGLGVVREVSPARAPRGCPTRADFTHLCEGLVAMAVSRYPLRSNHLDLLADLHDIADDHDRRWPNPGRGHALRHRGQRSGKSSLGGKSTVLYHHYGSFRGRPSRMSVSATCTDSLDGHHQHQSARDLARSGQSTVDLGSPGGTCTEITWNSWTYAAMRHRHVGGGGHRDGLVIPGTTMTGMPSAAQASISSPPRPKTNGSPPLSRTTNLPCLRVLDQQLVDLLLGHVRP